MSSSSSDSSSQSATPVLGPHQIWLRARRVSGSNTIFYFTMTDGIHEWQARFTVPNVLSSQGTGLVHSDPGSDVQGVMLFRSSDIDAVTEWDGSLEVEPARAQWHTERVEEIRIGSYVFTGARGELVTIPLAAGYNTTVQFDEEDGLRWTAATGIGLGAYPSSGPVVYPLLCINGLLPRDGDIPLGVSAHLGLQRTPGKIQVVVRA